MSEYHFNATKHIAEAFEAHDVKFFVAYFDPQEELMAGFSIDGGPGVYLKFISRDDDNDVAVRLYGLISKTPKEKRVRLLEVCNALNTKVRYLKFNLDQDGDVNVDYDFPISSGDECVGEMAFEIFIKTMKILDEHYKAFMQALYIDEESQVEWVSDEVISPLLSLLEKRGATAEEEGEDGDDDFEEEWDNLSKDD